MQTDELVVYEYELPLKTLTVLVDDEFNKY
jgi:hypothetical protein